MPTCYAYGVLDSVAYPGSIGKASWDGAGIMGTLHNRIKQRWIEQAEQDIRELRQEGSVESRQMADLLQEALDECTLQAVNPALYLEGSASAKSEQAVLEGAMDFMRNLRPH